MIVPGGALISSAGELAPSRSAAAWLAKTIRPRSSASVIASARFTRIASRRSSTARSSENSRALSIASAARRASSHARSRSSRVVGLAVAEAQDRERAERASAREQGRDHRRVVALVDHEARVLGALGERAHQRVVISASSCGSPLRITRATGCSPSGSSGCRRATPPARGEPRVGRCDRHLADRAVPLAQVDHAQIGHARDGQPRDLAHRRGQIERGGHHRACLHQQLHADVVRALGGAAHRLSVREATARAWSVDRGSVLLIPSIRITCLSEAPSDV